MKKYEAVFILDIRKHDDEGESFNKEFTKLIESWGGKMLESNSMGRKQFAREIAKRKAGIYWNFIFEASPEKVIAIRDKYKLDERIIREMIIVYDRPENSRTLREAERKEEVKTQE